MTGNSTLIVARSPSKPQLIYDGDCGFCRRWILRWKAFTGSSVEYETSETAKALYPEIAEERLDRAVQLIEQDGRVYEGAEAVYRVLAYVPGKSWLLSLYQRSIWMRSASEWMYRLVASHRILFSKLTRFLWGDDLSPSTFDTSSIFFIRSIGVIFLFAFISLNSQFVGLFGPRGILPVKNFLSSYYQAYGPVSWIQLPTLFWIHSGTAALSVVCWLGIIGSLFVIAGIYQAPVLACLWFFYLSFMNVGQDFMSFQWDALLLEAGFLAIFLASWKRGDWRKPLTPVLQVSPVIRILLCFLLFKLMYFSGVMKLRSGDPTWNQLTALTYHFETQPLPTWVAWYVHKLPGFCLQAAAWVVLMIEIAIPFLFFFPRRVRNFSAAATIGLQCLIIVTGNYCFFNLLAMALCLLLIDDQSMPERWRICVTDFHKAASRPKWPRWVVCCVLGLVLMGSLDQVPKVFGASAPFLTAARNFLRPLRTFNQYGLFTVMTTDRPEIIIEGSNNRVTWEPYEFYFKPGDVSRRPGFNMPHQPRLDWQLWFAALSSYDANPWFSSFCEHLLKGSPEVLRLIRKNPFKDAPPRYIQATLYDYKFSDLETRRKTGAWWVRERRSLYAPVISLRNRN